MVTAEKRAGITRWASPRAVVAIHPSRVMLPAVDAEPHMPIDLGDLRFLECAATPSGVALDDPSVAATPRLLAALEARGWLIERPLDQQFGSAKYRATAPEEPPAVVEGLLAGTLVLGTPMLLRCAPDGFEAMDHGGRTLAILSADELMAMSRFGQPTTVADARAASGADEAQFTEFVRRLASVGLLTGFDPEHPEISRRQKEAQRARASAERAVSVHNAFDEAETARDVAGGPSDRVRVIGFNTSTGTPPLALGMVIAAAKAFCDGMLEASYDFRPRLAWDRERFERAAAGPPAVFLFSNYVWCTEENLYYSALAKQHNPRHVTIHGGPNTPKYTADLERFFFDNPHVDVAVHGEGEATFPELLAALRGCIGDDRHDLSVLTQVPGLSFRSGGRVIRSANRDRIVDIDTIPSPILTGLLDGFAPAGSDNTGMIVETNRGCPYGCTFCDWGSATLSRIRQFNLDRVMAELEWCAREKFFVLGIADANFGIFERDVEIARKIAELKSIYGYPNVVGNNYAKNTTKHLPKIIEIMTEAGIVAEGKLSMQTFDQDTLATIHRKNIKVEKYHYLSEEFRRNRLPLAVELMMGLPGATPESFHADLQACIDRDVRAQIHLTQLLPNSPMNDPEYRSQNGINAHPGEVVRETSSFTRSEFDSMVELREPFYIFENFGVIRHVARYVRSETGRHEIDFYRQILRDVRAQPDRWPMMAASIQILPRMMVPPVSWKLFLDDVRDYLTEVVGIVDDRALETVLDVQHVLLPARDREFPVTIELQHDYAAWYATVSELRHQGHLHDWHDWAPKLREVPPGAFTVDDPFNSCQSALGFPAVSFHYIDSAWDLDSPVSRPRQSTPAEQLERTSETRVLEETATQSTRGSGAQAEGWETVKLIS